MMQVMQAAPKARPAETGIEPRPASPEDDA